jgi:uncharacterized protein
MWLGLVKLFIALTVYGAAIEPRIVKRESITAAIPNLPPAWEGKQIAVFADLQVGMHLANIDAARRLSRSVVSIHPAMVLIAGDFVYGADSNVADQMRRVAEILHPILDEHIPVYAVLGNHDYSIMHEYQRGEQDNLVARQVRSALRGAGVQMMDNVVLPLPIPRAVPVPDEPPLVVEGVPALYLVGIGERWANNDKTVETMAKVPPGAPRIVFMHNPDDFADIPAGEAPLALAAHTHGMQLGIPYVSDYLWRHYYSDRGSGLEGWIDHYGEPGNRLYINRGIGFSVVPARVNAFPELTVVTLRNGSPDQRQ